jgi:hypothetical protein
MTRAITEQALLAALSHHLVDVEAIAIKLAEEHKAWTYSGIDPTPAPLGDDSIGRAIESFIEGPFGSPGTETASAIITRAVQSVPVKRTGYSGLMIPVLEDTVLTKRWGEGTYTLDSILPGYSSRRLAQPLRCRARPTTAAPEPLTNPTLSPVNTSASLQRPTNVVSD